MRRSIPASTLVLVLLVFAFTVGMSGYAQADTYTFTGLGGGLAPLSIASNGSSLFAGMESGHVWRNTGGTDWIDAGNLGGTVNALVWDGATIYAGTSSGEVYYYVSDGVWSWAGYGAGWGNSVTCLVATGTPGNIYAGSSNRHVYWKNGSTSWLDTATDMGSTVLSLTRSSSYVYASTANGLVYRYNNNPSSPSWTSLGYCGTSSAHIVWSDSYGLYALGYNSHAWMYTGSSWSDTGLVGYYPVTTFTSAGSTLYAGNDHGQVWSYSGSWGNTSLPYSGGTVVQALAASGTDLFAASWNGHIGKYSASSWTDVWPTGRAQVNTLLSSGGVYAGCDNGQVYEYDGGWSAEGNNIGSPVLSLASTSLHMYAGCENGNVYWNNAGTWTSTAGPGRAVSLAFDGSTLYAGCDDGHIWYYDETGGTWHDGANLAGGNVYALAWTGTDLYAGTNSGEVFRYDAPGDFHATGLSTSGAATQALCWDGSSLYAGTSAGHVYSFDGANWSDIYPYGFSAVHSLAGNGDNVFAGSSGGQVFRYMGGTTWNESGRPGTSPIQALCWTGTYMWTGSDLGSYRATLTVPPTMTTDTAAAITSAGATLNGQISDTGGEDADSRGFRYRRTGESTWTDWTESGTFGTGAFSHAITGLDPATDYEYQACAHNPVGWEYGSTVAFETSPTPPAETATWYLAEGTNAWGFNTYITIENPNDTAINAKLTYMDPNPGASGKGIVGTRTVALPPLSQTTISSASEIGQVDFSTRVECLEGKMIAVDRTMYWTGEGSPTPGYHSSIGTDAPSKAWHLPEGSSAWGFETWTAVLNPNDAEANITLIYMSEAEGPRAVNKKIPAYSRATYSMLSDIGISDASIEVQSDIPVVAERSMYRNNRREGSCSIGAPTPAADYYLAEGATGYDVGFTTYVLVQNPNEAASDVTLTYQTASGPVPGPTFTMQPNSRKTVRVNDQLPPDTDVSTTVHGSRPIIAERAVYWNNGTGEAFHASIGLDSPHMTFMLPDGETGEGFETWTCVQNPNPASVTVRVTYLLQGGGTPVSFTDEIPKDSRKSYNMADKGITGRASVLVESLDGARLIMAERAMYWNSRGAGTDTIGGYPD